MRDDAGMADELPNVPAEMVFERPTTIPPDRGALPDVLVLLLLLTPAAAFEDALEVPLPVSSVCGGGEPFTPPLLERPQPYGRWCDLELLLNISVCIFLTI